MAVSHAPVHGGNVHAAARELRRPIGSILDFSASINPLGPSDKAVRVLAAGASFIQHYPDPDCVSLKRAIERRWRITPDRVVIGNGSTELIDILPRALSFRSALIVGPTYAEYACAVGRAGGKSVLVLAKKDEDPTKNLKKLTGGGPDYAFECVGSGELAGTAYKAIRRGGLAVVVGVAKPSDSTSLRTMTLPFEEKTITGSYFGSCVPRVDFPRMLALYLAGQLKLEELITRRYSIAEAPQAFADLESGRNARGVIVF